MDPCPKKEMMLDASLLNQQVNVATELVGWSLNGLITLLNMRIFTKDSRNPLS
jgi:hypothetical protein